MNGKFITDDYELNDKAIIRSLKESIELYQNGNIAEVEDICRDIADAIREEVTEWLY